MTWSSAKDGTLRVERVLEVGRISHFNRQEPSKAIRHGDTIKHVGGHLLYLNQQLALESLQERRDLVIGISRIEKLPHPQKTFHGMRVTAKFWGMTKMQVMDFFHQCRCCRSWDDADSIRDFVAKFVIPATRGKGMGMALMVNSTHPLEVDTMISHSWEENARQFFEDIDGVVKDGETVFICFLALYQPAPNDIVGPSISDQLGDDINNGPFFEVLHTVKSKGGRMITITHTAGAVYDRMWCVWEAYNAVMIDLPIEFTNRGQLFSSPTASSRNARCGNPQLPMNEDERSIRLAIEAIPAPTAQAELGAMIGAVTVSALLACVVCWTLQVMATSDQGAMKGKIFLAKIKMALAGAAIPKTTKLALICAGSGVWGLGHIGGTLSDRRDGYERLDEVVRKRSCS